MFPNNARLGKAGIKPTMDVLDSECLAAIVLFFARAETDYQLAPPGCHRANDADRAIQTGKHHLISGIITTDPSYHTTESDSLVRQGEWSLNMLHPSRVNLQISAATWLEG